MERRSAVMSLIVAVPDFYKTIKKRAFGSGILLLQRLRLARSRGCKLLTPQGSAPAFGAGEHELPSRADNQRQHLNQSHRELLILVQVQLSPPAGAYPVCVPSVGDMEPGQQDQIGCEHYGGYCESDHIRPVVQPGAIASGASTVELDWREYSLGFSSGPPPMCQDRPQHALFRMLNSSPSGRVPSQCPESSCAGSSRRSPSAPLAPSRRLP